MTPRRSITPAIRMGVMALVAGLMITGALAARNGWDSFINYDAKHMHAVALDLDASDVGHGSSAYRYGRVGLPALARILSGGDDELLPMAQMLVTPLAFAAVVAAAVAIAERERGRGWRAGLVVLAVPGLWIGFAAAWADTLLTACVLVSIWATLSRRHWPCLAAIALAALTKEVGVLCAVPAALAAARHGDRRGAMYRVVALAPAAIWWAWIRLQSGEWPALAHEAARTRAIAVPFTDVVSALHGGRGQPAAAALALVVGIIGFTVLLQHPRHPLAWSAGLWALLGVSLGDNVLLYTGDTLRVLTPVMCVVLLAAVVLRQDGRPVDATATATATATASDARPLGSATRRSN